MQEKNEEKNKSSHSDPQPDNGQGRLNRDKNKPVHPGKSHSGKLM